jgi:ATP-dependent 26S proteasome regulatory subunit
MASKQQQQQQQQQTNTTRSSKGNISDTPDDYDTNPTSRTLFRWRLAVMLCANCSGLYVDSPETKMICDDAARTIRNHHGFAWRWNSALGLQPLGNAVDENAMKPEEFERVRELQKESESPINALLAIPQLQDVYTTCFHAYLHTQNKKALELEPDRKAPILVVLENFHLFYNNNPLVIQQLISAIEKGRDTERAYLVIGAGAGKLPPALEPVLQKLERPLPDDGLIREIALTVALPYVPDLKASDQECLNIVFPPETQDETFRAVSGLSETEVENAFTLTLSEYGSVTPKPVFDIKASLVNKASSLVVCKPQAGFEMIGGLEALKEFTVASLRDRKDKTLFPKGVLLTGVPGTGKTALAKCLGREVGLPVVEFRLGALLGRFVGESEHAAMHALQVIERMAPIILIIDELEKALSGATDRGSVSDGGVMQHLLGMLLTWLQDKTSEVYVVGTANDIVALPPELSRAGRFDAVFFLDYPGPNQREKIWDIYRKMYDIRRDDPNPKDTGWTGTEIKQCCYTAHMLGRSLADAAKYLIPIGKTSKDKLEKLRNFAAGRFLDASRGGPYDPTRTVVAKKPEPQTEGVRRVRADMVRGSEHRSDDTSYN